MLSMYSFLALLGSIYTFFIYARKFFMWEVVSNNVYVPNQYVGITVNIVTYHQPYINQNGLEIKWRQNNI